MFTTFALAEIKIRKTVYLKFTKQYGKKISCNELFLSFEVHMYEIGADL